MSHTYPSRYWGCLQPLLSCCVPLDMALHPSVSLRGRLGISYMNYSLKYPCFLHPSSRQTFQTADPSFPTHPKRDHRRLAGCMHRECSKSQDLELLQGRSVTTVSSAHL
ncbi:hypothetical protein BU25DRAFT_410097 [Macroventuria anomochaeta]|uniref:Uncharacterized protein n=1 Tax=Macroventuria anomochaeta TaxID=301207 RepID=A0ACB6S3C6_9PLEO|nr:uncharacterized protein BU25DRAFT_410097 [Macroventuria anomochaeta]KAF2628533.1 hypothetical protein BU25DRAFT_410097 [Macroventuria anomochaeta]